MDTLHKILDLMWKQGISDAELCQAAGINKSAVTDWKKGKTKSYLKHIAKIAEVLGVTEQFLLGNENKKDRPEGQPLSELFSDLSEDELSKVIAFVDSLKSKRNS